jgi:sulfide:quinone oxidoreductase
MKHLVVLGAGTAGTMAANRLRSRLEREAWSITVVDPSLTHYYQPGFLYIPFGIYRPEQAHHPRRGTLHHGITLVHAAVDRVETDADTVHLDDGRTLPYDVLVIATGTSPRPEETPGMAEDLGGSIHEFYTYRGAVALRRAIEGWRTGRLVVHVTEMPIKCPVAPLEFAFLADSFFQDQGVRDDVSLTFVTPLPGAFTKPVASATLGSMLEDRGIAVEPDFVVERIDPARKVLVSYDEREVPYDLLVTVPLNMGADYVARSGLGDELNFVPTDRHTLLAKGHGNVFVVGDAADLPTSKAGSVAHFAVEVLVTNVLDLVHGRPLSASFDGHANCFIESGAGKGLLIDFNYDVEPLTGTYPLPVLGPLRLLEETRANHWGKLAFRWVYWNLLLPGRPIPLPAHMTMAGKKPPADVLEKV